MSTSTKAAKPSLGLSPQGVGVSTDRRDNPVHHEELPMNRAPRCGARTRAGKPCQSPAVRGKHRCRMHGGARGSGAPVGNRNALRHGRYTLQAIGIRREIRALLRASRELLVLG
jgi:hypothetical protein